MRDAPSMSPCAGGGEGGEESAAVPYIVFEYMDLGDLAALLRNSDPVVFRAARSPNTTVIKPVRLHTDILSAWHHQ